MPYPPDATLIRDHLAAKLRPYGQELLLQFWDELDTAGREQLAKQIEAVDFDQMGALYEEKSATHDWAALARRALPPYSVRLTDRSGA